MASPLKGTCHCGAVSVELPESASGVLACHCDDCRILHGNYFAALIADVDAVRWSGEDKVAWYDTSEKVRRSFCSVCGSRLAMAPRAASKILLSAGLFGRDVGRKVTKNLFGDSKPDWYELPHVEV